MIIPGASGIRTASRYQILLTAPVVALTVKGLMRYTSRFPRTVVFVMAMALILEQINLASPVNLNRITERERLGLLPPPPPSCQVFYASAPREGSGIISTNDKHYSANVDAMLIAEITHIPTINGISSYNPPDWDFDDPTKQDYPARVRAYAETHHLLGLCGLNMQTLQWSL